MGSAAGIEAALASELRAIGTAGAALERVRVVCKEPMCEVAGLTAPGRGERLEEELRSPAAQDSIGTWGMVPGPIGRVKTQAGGAILFYSMVPNEAASGSSQVVASREQPAG